jgi:hypothetical protein
MCKCLQMYTQLYELNIFYAIDLMKINPFHDFSSAQYY